MDTEKRIVTHFPLKILWTNEGEIDAVPGGFINKEGIKTLLSQGAVHFVIADCGLPLQWIPVENCYQYWKEIQANIADDPARILPENFPGSIAFRAGIWEITQSNPIILLEKLH